MNQLFSRLLGASLLVFSLSIPSSFAAWNGVSYQTLESIAQSQPLLLQEILNKHDLTNVKNEDGLTLLQYAIQRAAEKKPERFGFEVRCSAMRLASMVMKCCSTCINDVKNNDKLLMYIAAKYDCVEVVEKLVSDDVENTFHNYSGQTARWPFHIAVENGSVSVASFFLKLRPESFSRLITCNNATPLHLAARNGSGELAATLIELAPETIDAADAFGVTPTDYALGRNCIALAKLFLDSGGMPSSAFLNDLIADHSFSGPYQLRLRKLITSQDCAPAQFNSWWNLLQ